MIQAEIIQDDNQYSVHIVIEDVNIFCSNDTIELLKKDVESALELAFEGQYTIDDIEL